MVCLITLHNYFKIHVEFSSKQIKNYPKILLEKKEGYLKKHGEVVGEEGGFLH